MPYFPLSRRKEPQNRPVRGNSPHRFRRYDEPAAFEKQFLARRRFEIAPDFLERRMKGIYISPSPIDCRVMRVSPWLDPIVCGGSKRSMPSARAPRCTPGRALPNPSRPDQQRSDRTDSFSASISSRRAFVASVSIAIFSISIHHPVVALRRLPAKYNLAARLPARVAARAITRPETAAARSFSVTRCPGRKT